MPHAAAAETCSIAPLIESLAVRGYAVAPNFIVEPIVAALRSRALRLDEVGLFSPAAVGHGAERVERADIRGDRICWLDASVVDPSERSLFAVLEALRVAANRALQLGLFEFEGHYAIYAAGRGYARHRDRFRDDGARVLSVVAYLNDHWRVDEGGMLRLHLGNGAVLDVTPQSGTLTAFFSDRFPHEVLPATRQRLSIAGWFRRRA